MLRLVGNRFGPVLRTRPPIDSTAEQLAWDDEMVGGRGTGRFVRDPEGDRAAARDVLKR